jgi:hypothetical protein
VCYRTKLRFEVVLPGYRYSGYEVKAFFKIHFPGCPYLLIVLFPLVMSLYLRFNSMSGEPNSWYDCWVI